jgi:deoxyribodipyrimidine photolyase-related protein
LLVLLGNQLFATRFLPPPSAGPVFMAEDVGLCTYVRHHQQKIVLFLAAMRAYRDELVEAGYDVHYVELDPTDRRPYEEKLHAALAQTGAGSIRHFEIEDRPMELRLVSFARDHGIKRHEMRSPMFLCTREEFRTFAVRKQRVLMHDFYVEQRRRRGILVDQQGKPTGKRWSFDTENRKKLPPDVTPPAIDRVSPDRHVANVIDLVQATFANHPGRARDFGWPTTRKQWSTWLDEFIRDRLANFGPYEDAISSRSETVFHSLLSPGLNLGLLTPDEVLERVLPRVDDLPLPSTEGFIRQIIGWREFVRGIYREFGERQEASNFWSHERQLTDAWYSGETGIPPLDDTIQVALRLGWTHHIPRLMVVANLMTLCEIAPAPAHRWFMEMFIDSSEWVMGPNVYGMGIFSDGGIFATKPYICGSNYLLKMSDYGKGPWCDIVDGLYWRFIDKHRDFFAGNPRLAVMPRALDRINEPRRDRIFAAAENFLELYTDGA